MLTTVLTPKAATPAPSPTAPPAITPVYIWSLSITPTVPDSLTLTPVT